VISWIFYFSASVFWLIYGIAHKSKPIIVSYIFSAMVNLLVVIGVFIYG
jgi:hypothetical protein